MESILWIIGSAIVVLCTMLEADARLVCCVWQDLGIAVLENAIKACAKEIEKHKGKLLVKEAPRAVLSLLFLYILSYSLL